MDRQVRWLRQYVVWRVLRRLALEAAASACVFIAGAVALNASWPTAVVLGIVAAQCLIAARLATALMTGPVDVGYLVTWENMVDELRSHPGSDIPEDRVNAELTDTDFRVLSALSWGDESLGESGYALYGVDSELVLICVGIDDEPMVVLSRLSDGRLLLTTTEVVLPSGSLLVNPSDSATVESLIASHAKAIAELRQKDIDLIRVGADAVPDYLQAEWEAWDQLGPFAGSLVRVVTSRQPLSLRIGLPAAHLWRRAISATPVSIPVPVPVPAAADAPDASDAVTPLPTPRVPVMAQPPVETVAPPTPAASVPGRYPPGNAPSWTTKQRGSSRPIGSRP